MVDTGDLKSLASNGVRVRLPPRAFFGGQRFELLIYDHPPRHRQLVMHSHCGSITRVASFR